MIQRTPPPKATSVQTLCASGFDPLLPPLTDSDELRAQWLFSQLALLLIAAAIAL
ncbi:MAG TPA: hypothetical protein VFO46_21040 [Candidatus Sulfotelmatobacter sp.]|nr:hypothetical protein [Candidatus Sulfotelmatobacter sp.]